MQLRVLRLGLLQDGDVWISIFPEREEIFVRRLCFGEVTLFRIGPTKLQVRQRSHRIVEDVLPEFSSSTLSR